MKGIPLPANLPWELQLVFWVLILLVGTLLGLAVWFLLRHVNQQDTQFKEVKDGMSKQKGELETIKNQVVESTTKLQLHSTDIQKTALSFQGTVNQEILNIKKEVLFIEKSVERTSAKAEALEKKIDENIVAVTKMNANVAKIDEVVTAHHKSLSMGAQAMANQREKLAKIETEVTEIGKDVLLFKTKKHTNGGDKT